MRIGIDARELCGQPTGVGRYLTGLLGAWAVDPRARAHTFRLYVPRALDGRSLGPGVEVEVVPGAGGTWWEQVRLPSAANRDRLDAFFAPAYSAPLRLRAPLALTIHDVSFFAHPEWFRRREGARRRFFTRRAGRAARLVLTDSTFSKREIVRRVGLPERRIHVVAPGVVPPARAPAAQTAPARGPLVLFVGSIFNRRRLPDLIQAFARVARDDAEARLEIVGDNRTRPYQDLTAIAAAAGVRERVGIRSYVPEETLADLYARARAFAFLSEYEGFGLTPLEALANGVPLVLADTSVAREVCGDAALYVEAGDVAGTAAALRALLADEKARARALAPAPALLQRYTWDRAARDTLRLIESIAAPDD